jgi:hypothetical protein
MTPEQKEAARTLQGVLKGVLDAASAHLDDYLLIGALIGQAAYRAQRVDKPLTDEQVLKLWHEGREAVTAKFARMA